MINGLQSFLSKKFGTNPFIARRLNDALRTTKKKTVTFFIKPGNSLLYLSPAPITEVVLYFSVSVQAMVSSVTPNWEKGIAFNKCSYKQIHDMDSSRSFSALRMAEA